MSGTIYRGTEAWRWYGSIGMANAFDPAYLARAQFDIGGLYEQQGGPPRAG